MKPKRRIRLGRFVAARTVDPDNTVTPTVKSYPVDRRTAKADAAAWDARVAAWKSWRS
jgi:hypothetical protein